MKVSNFRIVEEDVYKVISADFVFEKPHGTKEDIFISVAKMIVHLFTKGSIMNPLHIQKTVWFRISRFYKGALNYEDAFFMIALPIAFALNENLTFEAPVSKEIYEKIRLVKKYFGIKNNIKVHVQKTSKRRITTNYGLLFTLGLDSFYSLLIPKNTKDTDTLVFVDGYDIPLYKNDFLRDVHKRITNVGRHTRKKTVFVSTNIKEVSDKIIGWHTYHIAPLFTVGLLLGFKTLYMSGEAFEWSEWGLRRGADKLFSTRFFKPALIAHTMTRDKKIRALISHTHFNLFIKNLRVCWKNVFDKKIRYNCSRCQKCLRTHLMLLALGVTKTPTFGKIQVRDIKRIKLGPGIYNEWQIIYKLLQKQRGFSVTTMNAIETLIKTKDFISL